jgi:hypothetical protein
MRLLYPLRVASLLVLITFYGCSGVNEFARYDITNSTIYFKSSAKYSASNVRVNLGEKIFTNKNPVEIILEEIGEGYTESEVQQKVNRAYKPDSVALSLSDGIKGGLRDYFNFTPVESSSNNPAYLFETRLVKFELLSGSGGIDARIAAEVLIVDRKSAKTVWRNTHSVRTPLKESVIGYYPDGRVKTAVSIINAIRLMQMTVKEISDAIHVTTEELSYELTDELRYDIAYRHDD